jgi:hypothetical protein
MHDFSGMSSIFVTVFLTTLCPGQGQRRPGKQAEFASPVREPPLNAGICPLIPKEAPGTAAANFQRSPFIVVFTAQGGAKTCKCNRLLAFLRKIDNY